MKRIILVCCLVVLGLIYFVSDNREIVNDYYDYINRDFLSHDYLGEDEYVHNTFTEATDKSTEVMDRIINDVVSGRVKIDSDISDDINLLYNNVLDIEERNRISIEPLKKYINKVMNSKNIEELIDSAITVEKELGVDIFTRIVVDKDFLDNKKNIVYLYPVTFAFGSMADYYSDDDYMTYKAYIKRGIVQFLVEYGYSKNEARMISSEVISFYQEIGRASQLSGVYEDVTKYYNIVDNDYLDDVYTKFDVGAYLEEMGIVVEVYSLVDEGQYKKINELLTDKYLGVWKKVILVEILSSYVEFLDSDYYKIVLELNNSLTGGKEEEDLEEDATNLVLSVFEEEFDKLYDEEVMLQKDKEYLESIFLEIKGYFRKMLKKNSWLSMETKNKAIEKLDKMRVFVGYQDNSDDSYLEVEGDSLVSNIIALNKSSRLKEIERLERVDEVGALGMSDVNAYYNPMTNAVYIPSSVVFLYDDDSYYEMLGTIGMVIAHEITHGFDYNGSLFDSNGNLFNWWNDEDRSKYSKLKEKVSSYYNGIDVIDGKNIDGDKTVNENIADMGALKIISGVAKENKASRDEMKVMYEAFAKFWKAQTSDSYMKLLLLNDSHSPNKYRVNAVLSNLDEFYDTYNVLPWNEMYIPKNKRVSVW